MVLMASSCAARSERIWAEQQARRLLEPLAARWRHTQGVAERADAVGRALERDGADVLVAAAFLHDVGYAPELRETGFHPLDGARFLKSSGRDRLAGLVAYHGSAEAEATQRGLHEELAREFVDERSLVSRALAYCDLTTDPEGRRIKPADRIAEIKWRYGPDAPESRALELAMPALLDDVRVVESMLRRAGVERCATRTRSPR